MKKLFTNPFFLAFLTLIPVVALSMLSGLSSFDFSMIFNPDEGQQAILSLRLMRTFQGFIVGGALALAGAACQAVLRNPLADPYILGVSGGASVGAALVILSGLTALSSIFLPAGAFIGGCLILFLVLLPSRSNGVGYATNVLLTGVLLGTVCSALLMLIISVLNPQGLNNITWWMLGSLQYPGTEIFMPPAIIICLSALALILMARETNLLSLGEELAHSKGISPMRTSITILCAATLMTAATTAISGIIGFLGLIIPHVLRRTTGADHRRLYPLSFIWGGLFLIACDALGRIAGGAIEIPPGVITALVGGPFFIWILNKSAKGR